MARNKLLPEILPAKYKYDTSNVVLRERSSQVKEVKLSAEFSVSDAKTEDEFKSFLKDFSDSSGSTWNMSKKEDKISDVKIKGFRKCHHKAINHIRQRSTNSRKRMGT